MISFYWKKLLGESSLRRIWLVPIVVISVLYYMNANASVREATSFKSLIDTEFSFYREMAEQETVESLYEDEMTRFKGMLDAYESGDHRTVHTLYAEHVQAWMALDAGQNLYAQRLRLEKHLFLAGENLGIEEVEFLPLSGVNFLVQCDEKITPYLLILIGCYVLSKLYTSSYRQKIDMDRLIAQKQSTKDLSMFVLGIGTCLVTLVITQAIPFVLGTIFDQSGSLRYPYLCYEGNKAVYKHVSTLFPGWLFLSLMGSLVIVLVVLFVSKWLKESGSVFLVSILLLAGGLYLVNEVEPLQKSAQYIPVTYFNSVGAASGALANQYSNSAVTMPMGTVVLAVTCIVLWGMIQVGNHRIFEKVFRK